MLFPLWSSSIHVKGIRFRIISVVGFSRVAFHLRRRYYGGLSCYGPVACMFFRGWTSWVTLFVCRHYM